MSRCIWCNRYLFPWQSKSPGRTMHIRCHAYVEAIQAETQRQYREDQYRLRWQQEDEL